MAQSSISINILGSGTFEGSVLIYWTSRAQYSENYSFSWPTVKDIFFGIFIHRSHSPLRYLVREIDPTLLISLYENLNSEHFGKYDSELKTQYH